MKVNFPALFQTHLQKYKFFFLFGNEPEIFERSISFIQKKLALPLQPTTEADVLTASPSSPSLFEEQTETTLTLVPNVTDKILNHVENLKDGIYIFTSEKARAQSKLVTYFTASPISLAIGAYASPLLTSEFEFLIKEMNLAPSFKGHLFKAYQNDYMGLLSALEKIKLFGEVPESHYEAFLSPSSSNELAPLIHASLLRDPQKVTSSFSLITPPDLISFLRSLARSFQTLCELMPFKKSPKTIAWQKLSPPVFFKDQPLYETALSRWSPHEAQGLLETLLRLEKEVKFSALPFSRACQDMLGHLG